MCTSKFVRFTVLYKLYIFEPSWPTQPNHLLIPPSLSLACQFGTPLFFGVPIWRSYVVIFSPQPLTWLLPCTNTMGIAISTVQVKKWITLVCSPFSRNLANITDKSVLYYKSGQYRSEGWGQRGTWSRHKYHTLWEKIIFLTKVLLPFSVKN